MLGRRKLASLALEETSKLRRQIGIAPSEPICIYDVAARLGIEVRFYDVPSMEGMYFKADPPVIIVSALRPKGRQTYTCAHEIGHHRFGHGSSIHEYVDDEGQVSDSLKSEEEKLVDTFANFLLMPKMAVLRGFSERGWSLSSPTPVQVFTVAGWLGVGYSALIRHLQYNLQSIDDDDAKLLLRTSPKQCRAQIFGPEHVADGVVVDHLWRDRPVDIDVGDAITCAVGVIATGNSLERLMPNGPGSAMKAIAPGITQLSNPDQPDWRVTVRVSKKRYVGRAMYRHEEEVSDDE